MKILYASANKYSSFSQLQRFIISISEKNINLKTAGYIKSCGNIHLNYTLDCLNNFTKKDKKITFNKNYSLYAKEIKSFSPDLIISDLDIYTSIIALELNIKLWQVNPFLLYYAISEEIRQQLKLKHKYKYLFENNYEINYLKAIIKNSSKNYILSWMCDYKDKFIISKNFEWARPEFILENYSVKQNEYIKINQENMFNYSKYCNDFSNSKSIICDGNNDVISDCFYNKKPYIFESNNSEIECIFNCEILKLINKNNENKKTLDISIDGNVKFISELLGE